MKQRIRIISAAIGLVMLAIAAQAGPALSADNDAAWTIQLTNTSANPAKSGAVLTFRVSLSCAAVAAPSCTNGKITIPYDKQSARYFIGAAPGHPLVKSAVGDNDGIVVTLDPNFPAGSTIEFNLVGFGSANGTTPDGYTIPWTAVVDGDNTDPVASNTITETYTAEAELQIKKFLPADAPDGTPMPVDETFRYRIRSCDPRSANATEPGRLYLQNGTVVDTLQDGVRFVAASPNGVYDAEKNTVTWPAVDTPNTGCSSDSKGAQFWVDVQYPSPRFKAGDEVSNTVKVSGVPYGETEPITATHTLPHTLGQPTASGVVCKRAVGGVAPSPTCNASNPARTWAGPWHGATEAQWILNATNKSTTTAQLDIVDPLPCRTKTDGLTPAMYLSNTTGPPCADPVFTVRSIGPFRWGHSATVDDIANSPWLKAVEAGNYPAYVTPAGDVKPFVRQDTGGQYVGNSKLYAFRNTTFVPQADDVVSEVRWTGVNFATGEVGLDFPVSGYTDEDLKAGERLENTAQFVFRAGTATFTATNIARLQIIRDVIATLTKGVNSATAGTFNLQANIQDGGTDRTWDEGLVLADLLPPGVPDAELTGFGYQRSGGKQVPASAYTFEKIFNYNGTGRTLIRLTLAKGFKIDAGGLVYANFTATGGFPPGGRTNEGRLYLAGVLIDSCAGGSVFTSDSDDWDGDGVTSPDTHCRSAVQISVTGNSPLIRTIKEVKGNLDQNFARFPSVGQIDPSQPGGAQYRVTVANDGNVAAKNIVVYDVFPRPGDTGVSATQVSRPRNSDFATALSGPITPPAGWTVEYSRATNPCREEVGDGSAPWPASCTNDWSATLPANLASVTAARFKQNAGATLAPASSAVFTWSVSIPSLLPGIGVPVVAPLPAPGDVAWNTTALSATRVDNNAKLPPSEPPKVGLAVPETDVSLAKTVTPKAAMVGQEVEYTITVKHDTKVVTASDGSVSYVDAAGNPTGTIAPASGVVVADALPPGLEYVRDSEVVSRGSFDSTTGRWTVGTLRPGETAGLTYRARIREAGTHVNRAEVIANGVSDADSAPDNCTGLLAEDEDDCATATVQSLSAAIRLQKLVKAGPASDDFLEAPANSPERGVFPSGAAVPYRFVVTNTGEVPLTDVKIDDAKLPVGCEEAFAIGDLAAGASKTVDCTWGAGWGAGVTLNTATASGQPPAGGRISDDDDAQVFVPSPAIAVKKYTNGVDADTPDAAVATSNGAAITWRYVITNSGSDPLTDLTLVDDKEADVKLTDENCERSEGEWGDAVPVGASITCEFTGTAVYGFYTNTATATGKGTVTPIRVTASDVSSYLAPQAKASVSVKKYTNGRDGDDADDRPKLDEGAPVTWKYVIVNDGNEPLTDLSLVDDKEARVALTDADCDRSAGAWGEPLAPGDAITCTFTGTAKAGDYVNRATVTAVGTVTTATVTETDVSGYHGDPQPTPRQVVAAATGRAPSAAGAPAPSVADKTLARTGGAGTIPLVLTGVGLLLIGYSVIGDPQDARRAVKRDSVAVPRVRGRQRKDR